MDIKTPLKEFGLTDKEVDCYLALLPFDDCSLAEIAQKLDIPRTTVYNVLNQLHLKGLVSRIARGGATRYSAIDPSKIVGKIEEKKKLFEMILPDLEARKKNTNEKFLVEAFNGSRGIFTMILDIFEKNQQTYYFGSYHKSLEVLKHLPAQARFMRMDKKIPAKIVIEKYHEELFDDKQYQKITEMRFNNDLKDFPLMVFVYGKKVAIYTLEGEPNGVIISNSSFSEGMKKIFDNYWGNGRK